MYQKRSHVLEQKIFQRANGVNYTTNQILQFNRKGLNISFDSVITNIEIGKRSIGEKNIYNNPYLGYTDYLDGPFPSGNVEQINFGQATIQWWWKPNLSFFGQIYYNSNLPEKNLEFNIGVDIFYALNAIL